MTRILPFAVMGVALSFIPAFGQSVDAHLPVGGFVYDGSVRGLRPMLGIPGSSYLGAPVVENLDAAWSSPNRDIAVFSREGSTRAVRGLKTLTPFELETELLPGVTKVAWSASGNRAVLYKEADGSLQNISFTPGAMKIGLSSTSPARITQLVVSNSGRIALATSDGLFALSSDGNLETLWSASPSAVAFSASERLFAASGEAIYEILSSGALEQVIAVGASALAVTSDRIWALDATGLLLTAYDFTGNKHAEVHLDRAPSSTLEALQPGDLFLLNGPGSPGQAVSVLSTRRDEPGAYFVPVGEPVAR